MTNYEILKGKIMVLINHYCVVADCIFRRNPLKLGLITCVSFFLFFM